MAYRRSLTTKARLFAQQRFTPSISHITHDEDRKTQHSDNKSTPFLQNRSYSSLGSGFTGGGVRFQDPRWSQIHHAPMTASGLFLARNMSTDEANKIDYMYDVADVLADKTMEVVSTQAPSVSEVAVAAADSWIPVAALQYAIDGVHSFTGLNWNHQFCHVKAQIHMMCLI